MDIAPILLQAPKKPDIAPEPRAVQRIERTHHTEKETHDDKKLKKAAQEFESIFLAQLLSKMRESSTQTDFLGSQSTPMKIFNGMLDEQYALEMAKTGQIGLAEMIIEQLTGTPSDIPIGAADIAALPLENLSQSAFIELLSANAETANLAQLQRLQAELLLANQQMNSQLSPHNASQPPLSEFPASAQDLLTHSSRTMALSLSQTRNLDAASLAALMSSTPGDPTGDAGAARLLNPDQVMIQIINRINPRLGAGVHEAIINLEPPTLGRLHIRLVLEDGALSARIHVRNAIVGEIVRSNFSQLRSALYDQGVQVDHFHVTAGNAGSQEGTFAWHSHSGDWQESMSHSPRDSVDSNSTASLSGRDGAPGTAKIQPSSSGSYMVNQLV